MGINSSSPNTHTAVRLIEALIGGAAAFFGVIYYMGYMYFYTGLVRHGYAGNVLDIFNTIDIATQGAKLLFPHNIILISMWVIVGTIIYKFFDNYLPYYKKFLSTSILIMLFSSWIFAMSDMRSFLEFYRYESAFFNTSSVHIIGISFLIESIIFKDIPNIISERYISLTIVFIAIVFSLYIEAASFGYFSENMGVPATIHYYDKKQNTDKEVVNIINSKEKFIIYYKDDYGPIRWVKVENVSGVTFRKGSYGIP